MAFTTPGRGPGTPAEINLISSVRSFRSEGRMESAVRFLMIETIKARLASCEAERSTLTREVLSPSISTDRKIDALINRAALQTESLSLQRELDALEAKPMRRAHEEHLRQNARSA